MSPLNKNRRGPLPGSPQVGGRKPLPDKEKRKQGFWSVKAKYFKEVEKKIEQLTRQYK